MVAIDRLLHHAHILELTCESYKAKEAVRRRERGDEPRTFSAAIGELSAE